MESFKLREVIVDDRPISVAFIGDGGLLTLVSGRTRFVSSVKKVSS